MAPSVPNPMNTIVDCSGIRWIVYAPKRKTRLNHATREKMAMANDVDKIAEMIISVVNIVGIDCPWGMAKIR